MSEQDIKNTMPEELSDILLVFDKEKKKIQAVKGINEKGELETVEPTRKNESQFMRVDKHGDIFSNFFSNFLRQLKNPTKFSFFKIPAPIAVDAAEKMQKHIDNPNKEGEAIMKEHEIKTETKPEQKTENQNKMETTQTTPQAGEYKYKPEQIDWETMAHLGLSKERLEKMNLLDPLLKGYKTNDLVPVSVNLETTVLRTDARLSLHPGEGDMAVVAIHGVRREPQLNFPFFGHEFTKEDKEKLLSTGNMGRIVELVNPKTKEMIPSIISVDRLTNEIIALRTDLIKIPEEIKGVKLDNEQKQTLMEGKPLYLEGMISKKGEPFSATVQFNADKRYVEFLFDRSNTNKQSQQSNQQQGLSKEAPQTFRGVELTDKQYDKFKTGTWTYVDGLVDKKGVPYQGYIKLNQDTGKTEFSFNNPNSMKDNVRPAEANKTQIAVNSEGKTNEATKNIKEPLKSEQQVPKDKKQQMQQKPKAPTKSKGRKM